MHCPTVRVVSPISDENPHGYIVINESDLTEDHKVFEEVAESGALEGDATEPRAKRKYTKKTDE